MITDEFIAHESGSDTPRDQQWYRWLSEAEKAAGLSTLDGDEADGADGYSLDGAYDAWEAGQTPEQYVAGIPERKAAQEARLAILRERGFPV